VLPTSQPLPAEDVDRQEYRFEEEEDPLDREQHPENLPEALRELGPEQPELEREHRAGYGADREGHRRDLRPALCQLQRDPVVAAQPDVVGDQHHRREAHAEASEDDVEAEREGHLLARGEQLVGGKEGCQAIN
jgi:hypothetical protein